MGGSDLLLHLLTTVRRQNFIRRSALRPHHRRSEASSILERTICYIRSGRRTWQINGKPIPRHFHIDQLKLFYLRNSYLVTVHEERIPAFFCGAGPEKIRFYAVVVIQLIATDCQAFKAYFSQEIIFQCQQNKILLSSDNSTVKTKLDLLFHHSARKTRDISSSYSQSLRTSLTFISQLC